MPRGLSTEKLGELVENLNTKGLLQEVNGEWRIKLDSFNNNLKLASENLGVIVPDIVEISKEQVALINHGLEGVINFIRAFQTVNTSFALMAENPDEIKEFIEDFKDIRDLEGKIIEEVKDTLINLDSMLEETFKETGEYYYALGQIIYSEEEGKIRIDFSSIPSSDIKVRKNLRKKMKELGIYTGKREISRSKGLTKKKGLGLVQLITALEKVSKKIKNVDDDSIEYYEAKSAEKGMKIILNKQVFEQLQSLRGNLLDSLYRVGFLFKDESDTIKRMAKVEFKQNILTKYGKKNVNKIKNALKKDVSVVDYFIKKALKINDLNELKKKVNESEKAKMYNKIIKLKNESENAKETHDEIVKNQIKFINKVVRIFAEIISLWGDQVDDEIHIGQVADKTIIAMTKLGEVQMKIDPELNNQTLLIARKTQDSIKETSDKAKDLKNVGKVMQFLLKRVKALVGFNESIEAQIQKYHSESNKAEEYKMKKLKKIKKLIYEKYPNISEEVSGSVKNFNEQLSKLTQDRNLYENTHLFTEFNQYYKYINKSFDYFINEVSVKTEDVDVNNFEKYCEELGTTMSRLEEHIDLLFKSFNGLGNTFKNDFNYYMRISNAYQDFVNQVGEMLDLMDYVIATEEKLVRDKIDLKTLNIRIRAFQKVFKKVKQSQEKQASVDEDLTKMMEKVGLTGSDFYEDYLTKFEKELQELYERLENYVKKGYFTKERMEQAYKEVEEQIKRFKVDFKDYNKELKGMKVGFFQKLFKTQSYKKSKFWDKLKNINNSFKEFDNKMKKIEKKEFKISKKEGMSVEEFCENSVMIVKEIMKGLNEIVNELYDVSKTMEFVVENLKELTNEGYLNSFEEMLNSIDDFNEKVNKIEEKRFDLEEIEKFQVSNMIKSLKSVTKFDELSEQTAKEALLMKEYTEQVEGNIETVRKSLLKFFYTYLNNVYSEDSEEGKKYRKALAEIEG